MPGGEGGRERGARFPKAAQWQGGGEESVLLEPPSSGCLTRGRPETLTSSIGSESEVWRVLYCFQVL